MEIKRISAFTGVEHIADIDVTPEQIKAWQDGELIQNAMPNLTAEEREFIKTGVTPQEWDDVFGPMGDA